MISWFYCSSSSFVPSHFVCVVCIYIMLFYVVISLGKLYSVIVEKFWKDWYGVFYLRLEPQGLVRSGKALRFVISSLRYQPGCLAMMFRKLKWVLPTSRLQRYESIKARPNWKLTYQKHEIFRSESEIICSWRGSFSPLETICNQNLLSGKNKKKYHQFVVYWICL